MKVLHIIDTLWLGGAQSLLKSIFEHQKNNSDIFLYPLRTREFNIVIDHPNLISNASVSRFSLSPLKKIRQIIIENKITILHCHLPRAHVFGYLVKRFYFPEIKLILHEHGEIFENYHIYKPLLKLFSRKTDLFICVSKTSERELLKTLKGKDLQISVLYNFIEASVFNKSKLLPERNFERHKLGFSENDFVFGFAGRLFRRKGWREFISAAYLLRGRKTLKFLMAGTGTDKKKLLQAISQSGMSQKITFLGYVDNMLWFYSLIDCFVIPSHWEGLPIAQLEARALGIPVIVSDGPGLNELDDENMLVFENKNPAGLASKISELMDDKALRARLSISPDFNNSLYSVDLYCKSLDKLYEKLFSLH